MGVELNEDCDDIFALGTACLGGALSDVDIGDASSSSDDGRSSPRARCVNARFSDAERGSAISRDTRGGMAIGELDSGGSTLILTR